MKVKKNNLHDFTVQFCNTNHINKSLPSPMYSILVLEGTGNVSVDLINYVFDGIIVLFATPYQIISFTLPNPLQAVQLQFHGDFYCIEYHKKEVACNGLLFNNIYLKPYINLQKEHYLEMKYVLDKLTTIQLHDGNHYSDAVVKAYLQLILALCSNIKSKEDVFYELKKSHHPIMKFKELLENNFYTQRQPSFYAAQLGISPNNFSKICKQHFLKTPSNLIHERVILESKKLIHLTYKSFKEIAAELNFDDENYFSRYFKKHTQVTPTAFRENVGISIVADLSR